MTRVIAAAAAAMILSLAACADDNNAPATSDRIESPSPAVAKSPPSAPQPAPTRTPVPTATAIVTKLLPTATPSPVPTALLAPVPTWTPKARRSTPTPIPDEVIAAHMSGDKIEDKATDFELTLFDGETLRLSELQGQVVVLNFWASWCPPCRWEMPSFEKTYQEYKDDGVLFVGVAISDFESAALEFAEATGVTYPIGLDVTGEIARAYRVLGLPTTIFIDTRGNIARRLSNVANEAVLKIFIEGQIRSTTGSSSG